MINGDDIDDISSPLLEKSLITPELKTNKQTKKPSKTRNYMTEKLRSILLSLCHLYKLNTAHSNIPPGSSYSFNNLLKIAVGFERYE